MRNRTHTRQRLRLLHRLSPTARRLVRSEGFSLIELGMALGIFAIVASVTASLLATGLRGTLLAKRREVATQEASRVLELARSLAYDELGLVNTDPTISTDPAIVDVAGVLSYAVATGNTEPIMWAGNPSGHPFDPHQTNTTRGSTDLTTSIYVTAQDEDGDGEVDLKRVTATVSWNDTGTAGLGNSVTIQSLVHPGGQLTTPSGGATSGTGTGLTPMSANVSSRGLTGAIRVGVGDPSTDTDAVLPADSVVLSNPTTNGSTVFRAVSAIDCSSRSAFLQDPTGTTYGGHPLAVAADDDARTATSSTPASSSWTGSDPVSGGDETNRLLAEASLESGTSCAATTSDADGVAPTDDDLPYELGTGTTDTALNFVQDITAAGLGGNDLTVAHTGTQSVSQEIDHAIVSSTREIHAAGTGSVGATQVMAVPTDIPQGLVAVDGFGYSASIAASPVTPSQAPAVTSDTFTIKIFDPEMVLTQCDQHANDYCEITVDADDASYTGLDVVHTGTMSANGGLTTLSFEVDVNALPPMTDPLEGEAGSNAEVRWGAGFTPLQVSVALQIHVEEAGATTRYIDAAAELSFGNVSAAACAGVACR